MKRADTTLRDMAMKRSAVYAAHPRQRERAWIGLTTVGYCAYGAALGFAAAVVAFWV